ncbi:MAG: hypothetical protein ACK504_10075 [Bacteroidota bacterium]
MNLTEDSFEKLFDFAKSLEDKHLSYDEIEKQLFNKTNDVFLVSDIIKHLKKNRDAVKRKQGLTKIAFGAVFLVVGFFITVFNFHSNQSFTIVMYGSSVIGLLFIFWGLYDIIG